MNQVTQIDRLVFPLRAHTEYFLCILSALVNLSYLYQALLMRVRVIVLLVYTRQYLQARARLKCFTRMLDV